MQNQNESQKSSDSKNFESDPENIFLKYNLDETDRQMMRLLINNPGISNTDLGKLIGITEQAISKRRRRDTFQKAFAEQLMTAPELFKKAQELAIRRLISFIQGKNEKYAFEASKIFAYPLVQAQVNTLSPQTEQTIVFRTRIGPTGEVIRLKTIDGIMQHEDAVDVEVTNDDN